MDAALLPTSSLFYRCFSWYACRLLRRHFTAVRLSRGSSDLDGLVDQPLVIYLNHPSWWDPLVGLALARSLFPNRRHHAPIDARALDRYRFFAKLGFFGIDVNASSGGTRFLRTALRIVRSPNSALWITAQGQFTDSRFRPIRLQPGLAHLVRHMKQGWIVPLALDYPFWDQKLPEVLVRWGTPIHARIFKDLDVPQANQMLGQKLEETLETLTTQAITRNALQFETLLSGTVGTHGVYDAWGWLKARLNGQDHVREHRVRA